MLVVTLGGSPSQRSRSGVLLDHAKRWLNQQGIEVVSYQIRDFNAEDLLHARFGSPQVVALLQHIEQADGLVIATPVYKASFSGALKTVLDLLPERALSHKVVLPMATAPAAASPTCSPWTTRSSRYSPHSRPRKCSTASSPRTARSPTAKAAPRLNWPRHWNSALARRPKPLDPALLNDRLLSARWSI